MILPTEAQPFFDSTRHQQFDDDKPLVLAGSYAHYANYRLAARLKLLPDHGSAQSFSSNDLQQIAHDISHLPCERLMKAIRSLDAETRDRNCSAISVELAKMANVAPKLDSQHPSSPLFLSLRTYLYGMFKSGEMAFCLDRTTSAEGIIQPLANAHAGLMSNIQAETVAEAQVRGMREKIGVQPMSIHSLGQLPINGTAEFIAVETDNSPLPGLKIALRHVGFVHIEALPIHVTNKITVGPDVMGLILLNRNEIGLLTKGETHWLRLMKSRDPATRLTLESARQHYGTTWEQISASQLGEFVSTRRPRVSDERSRVDFAKDVDSLIATSDDFRHGHDHLATSLQIMHRLGIRQSLGEAAYIQKAVDNGQAVGTLSKTLEAFRPTKYPRDIPFVR